MLKVHKGQAIWISLIVVPIKHMKYLHLKNPGVHSNSQRKEGKTNQNPLLKLLISCPEKTLNTFYHASFSLELFFKVNK